MKRRVVQHGPSTLIFSLPSKWVKEHGIQKGDELEVEERGKNLVVKTEKKTINLKTEITINNDNPITPRLLGALHKKGYDEIKIKFEDLDTLGLIQESLKEHVGFEIVEQNGNHCLVKTIAGEYDSEFDSMLKRLFSQILVMNGGAITALEKKEEKLLPNLRFLETDNNKYTSFCRRVLNKGGGLHNPNNLTFLYCTVEELEKIGDEYKYLCDFLLNKKLDNIDPKVIKIFKELHELITCTHELFFAFSKERMNDTFNLRKKIIADCFNLFDQVSKKDLILLEYAKKITQMCANILSFKITMEL